MDRQYRGIGSKYYDLVTEQIVLTAKFGAPGARHLLLALRNGSRPDMSQILQQLGIDRMSSVERLELIGQIWDSVPDSAEALPPPDWHRTELESRRAAAEADPGAGIPWEVVKARLADRS